MMSYKILTLSPSKASFQASPIALKTLTILSPIFRKESSNNDFELSLLVSSIKSFIGIPVFFDCASNSLKAFTSSSVKPIAVSCASDISSNWSIVVACSLFKSSCDSLKSVACRVLSPSFSFTRFCI